MIFELRNLINTTFMIEMKLEKSVLVSVRKSQSNQSFIFYTMNDFSAQFLIENEKIWRTEFEKTINSEIIIEKDEKWEKFVIHHISMNIFEEDEELIQLQDEIERFNNISLKKSSVWLTSLEKRTQNKYASILVFTENQE